MALSTAVVSPTFFSLAAVPVSILLYMVVSCIYRIFFHPLAKVPGPKLYACTSLPYFYHLLTGSWSKTLLQLHNKYGQVVRFTPTDVSLTTSDAWKRIYGHKHGGELNYDKDLRIYSKSENGKTTIVTSSDADHRRSRRLLSHAFSDKALRGQEHIMKHYVDLLISQLRTRATAGLAVDLVTWYNFTTFDLIGDLAFGEPFGCLQAGVYHPWVAMIFQGIKSTTVTQAMWREPLLLGLPLGLLPRSQKLMKSISDHHKLSENTVLKRLRSGSTEREDFTSYILRYNTDDKEHGMSEPEIVANANLLIIAGSETTATLLSGATFYLLSNQDPYNKLVAEIRSAFATEDDINLNNVGGLTYLAAVLNEGFRMYPPVPIGLSRFTPKGGDVIEGYYMPEGTIVSVPQWAAYQSENNFRDPQAFIPERWLGDPRFAHDNRDVLNPFSVGPRNCIGKNLAYAEMRLILARLIWNFDMEIQPECRRWNEQKAYNFWEKGALNVKLTPVLRD